ncbi:hypothetical protein BKA93DRAFT_889792 [Sparassis latifolia]
MDVVQNAEAMLVEVESQSLQRLLTAVRSETSSPRTTEIPALDAHLSAISARALGPGDVIEIQGPAASGKSHLLYYLLMTCVIPTEYRSIKLGGWAKAAVLFDTDGTFSIRRFHQLLVSRLSSLLSRPGQMLDMLSQLAPTPAEELASQCLASLHILRPTSSQQLAASLVNLQEYHSTNSDLQSLEIGILAIDSMSAFYWKDRFTVERWRSCGKTIGTSPSSTVPLQHILASLQDYRLSHGSVIVMTNWGLNPKTKASSHTEPASFFYKQHLYPFPRPFDDPRPPAVHLASTKTLHGDDTLVNPPHNAADAETDEPQKADSSFSVTHHITLHPLPANPFPTNCTLGEAKREDTMRSAVMEQGKIRALVRTPGQSSVGEFLFCIHERDISVDVRHSLP